MKCPTSETAARWLLHELSDEEANAFEEHYFGCDACLEMLERLEKSRILLENALPAILTPERRRELEQRPEPVPAVHVHAGERRSIRLGPERPIGIWVLHAELEHAAEVDIAVFAESGAPVLSLRDVPFDRGAGEVVLACHTHYRHLAAGTKLEAELSARSSTGEQSLGRYVLCHEFEG